MNLRTACLGILLTPIPAFGSDSVPLEISPAANEVALYSGDLGDLCDSDRPLTPAGSDRAGSRKCVPLCAAESQTGCLSNSDFPAAALSGLVPDAIRVQVTIGAVAGQFPSSKFPLDGGRADVDDLPLFGAAAAGRTFEWFDSLGGRHTLATQASQTVTPGIASVNFAEGPLREVQVPGAPNLVTANVRTGATLFATAGGFPSSAAPLDGASAGVQDLTAANLATSLQSAQTFEWFNSRGSRQTKSGSTDLKAENVKVGVELFGVTGTLVGAIPKFCRNTARTAAFDGSTAPSIVGLDALDPLDDENAGGAGLPADLPFGGDFACDAGIWTATGVDAAGAEGFCDDAADDCVKTDGVTNLWWSEEAGSGGSIAVTWIAALSACDDLSLAGQTDWRLPTQKELAQAYIDGIRGVMDASFVGSGVTFWSSTTLASNISKAWHVNLQNGLVSNTTKALASGFALCVRP